MITRFAKITSRMAAVFTILFTIAGCGGGGGAGGGEGFLPDDGGNQVTYIVTLALIDANGNETRAITSTTPATLQVTVTTSDRIPEPVADVIVTAGASRGLVTPGSGLTNADGAVSFQVEAAAAALGAGTLTATVDGPAGPVSSTWTFQVGQADLRLGYFDRDGFILGEIGLNATNLPAGGSALLSLAVVDENGEAVSTTEEVRLSSPCAQSGLAILPFSVNTLNGLATATYTATGCDGDDQITATLVGGSGQATATVNVASPTVNSINFVSAEPPTIALKGTGGAGRQETSTVTFKVVDGGGNPLTGVLVEFGLSTEVGGLSLANATAFTDVGGLASTVVQSGNVATPVRVTATIEADDGDGNILTLTNISDILIVSTGLPDQDSISLSAEVLNAVNAAVIDGIQVVVTVRMADRFQNPVPDGTNALFTTEYGSIQPSCTTLNGNCSVNWTSQAPRFPLNWGLPGDEIRTIFEVGYNCPSHNGSSGPCPDDLGYTRGLRSSILVVAIGEETFVDDNANGVYDEGETFENLPEAFNDHNEDGIYTKSLSACFNTTDTSPLQCKAGFQEEFKEIEVNGEYDLNTDAINPNGVFNGVLCPVAGDGIWCSRELVHVRDSLTLILSNENDYHAVLVQGSSLVSGTFEGNSYIVYISDSYNNPPAGGANITLTASGDGKRLEGLDNCKVVGESSFSIPANNGTGALGFPVQTTGGGTLLVKYNGTTIGVYSCDAPDPPVEEEDDGLTLG